ncbi:MAG TPA: hypothetical protein DDW91_06860 [Shewanella frigidimarina]|nr:hypothetical protein [Shewanella frigidimarina]
MTTIANFEDIRLLEHIKTSGLLTSFTDCFGNAQGATDSVAGNIDLTNLDANKRAVLVRRNGGDSFGQPYQSITEYPMLIVVFSKVVDSDLAIANGLANDIYRWLITNYQSPSQCIMAISTRGVSTPLYTEDSRAVFEIPLTVKFSI